MKENYTSQQLRLVAVDVIMLWLVVINLGLILFDFTYEVRIAREFFARIWPAGQAWYQHTVHENFFFIDLCFVAVFLLEFFVQWILAAVRKTYEKWFWYPIFHFYDLLGCIPIGSMRFLRVLRVISLLIRLDRMGVIKARETGLFRSWLRFRGILVEEVSDRVVIKMLEGIKDEFDHGGPIAARIVREVVEPRQVVLVDWMAERLGAASMQFLLQYREDMKEVVHRKIETAVREETNLQLMGSFPMLGRPVVRQLERTVGDIVYKVLEDLIDDLSHPETSRRLIGELTDSGIQSLKTQGDGRISRLVRDMAEDCINIVIERVAVKEWRQKNEQFDEPKPGE